MKPNMLHELRVLTGLHRGAALPLTGEQWSIGSSSSADLALYDPGIKDHHCLLQRIDDTWSLMRKEGVITDSEGHRVDEIAMLKPGTPFALNGVWLSVVSANTEWPPEEDEPQDTAAPPPPVAEPQHLIAEPDEPRVQATRTPRSLLGLLLLIGALVTFLMALLWVFNRQEPLPVHQGPAPKSILKDSAQVQKVLGKMLKERELQGRISVVEEKGKIYLHGRFEDDDLLQLTERMLQRFEHLYQSPLQVLSALPEAAPLLPFTVVQISSARPAHVLTSDGRRLFLGDEVGGVRLVEINDHRVIFEGDRRVELSW